MKSIVIFIQLLLCLFLQGETSKGMKRISIDQYSIGIPENWTVTVDKENKQTVDSGQLENGEHVAFYVYPKKIDKKLLLEGYLKNFADGYTRDSRFKLISQKIESVDGLRYGFLEAECPGHNTKNPVHWNVYLLPMQPGEYFIFEFYSEKTVFIKYQELFRKIFLSIQ